MILVSASGREQFSSIRMRLVKFSRFSIPSVNDMHLFSPLVLYCNYFLKD